MVVANFSRGAFENLSDKEKSKLSGTAQDLFSFINQLAIYHKVKNNIKIYLFS